jgi:hypothetical protein
MGCCKTDEARERRLQRQLRENHEQEVLQWKCRANEERCNRSRAERDELAPPQLKNERVGLS